MEVILKMTTEQALSWRGWLIGYLNAALSGITAGGASMFFGLTWQKALGVAGAAAWMSLGKWMAQHPLPGSPAD